VRIALLSPYSWSYPGGVTRHIEALAAELRAGGDEVAIVGPYDPDDALTRRLHRGVRPQQVAPPEGFISLGRTVGFPANGAVSNLAVSRNALLTLREELRGGGYDVIHMHEPVAPIVCWDALGAVDGPALVGTYHSYSENPLTNGIGVLLGARRRMNRLHGRIAVSEAAAWTAERFFGGRCRVIPNGVDLRWAARQPQRSGERAQREPEAAGAAPLRILFIGQAVARKGLPVLLSAFEALRAELPATLTLVGPLYEEVAPLLLEQRGVQVLGRVSEERKRAELASADVLCAPSLRGESFGMVLTEAFAAGLPVVASDIHGYRDVVRDRREGLLVPPGDRRALAEALRAMAAQPRARQAMARSARARAERYAWGRVAAEVRDAYERSLACRDAAESASGLRALGMRYGLRRRDQGEGAGPPAARQDKGSQSASAQRRVRVLPRLTRRRALGASTLAALGMVAAGLANVGVGRVETSLAASKPALVIGGLALMAGALAARAASWRTLMGALPSLSGARMRDALRATLIGVLMSATLPARLGEPSRALVIARRLGGARARLPDVLSAMVAQMLLNVAAVLALGLSATLGTRAMQSRDVLLTLIVLVPALALIGLLFAPLILPGARSRRALALPGLRAELRDALARLRAAIALLADRSSGARAAALQLGAWGLQLLACYLLAQALGLAGRIGFAGAAAVLFAVNVTALVPAGPANVGVFQLAVLAVLHGAFGVGAAVALAYGLLLQGCELALALGGGLPALARERLSWRQLRLQSLHAMPIELRSEERVREELAGAGA